MSPAQRRAFAHEVVDQALCSQRKACRFLKLARSTFSYRGRPPTPAEAFLRKRLVELSTEHLYGEHAEFSNFIKSIDTVVRKRIEDARERLLKRKYRLQLYYVSPGKISKPLRDEAYHSVRCKDSAASFDAFDGKRLIFLLRDYLDGVAPPVPSLDLEIESGQGVRVTGILNRFDAKTEIESWFPKPTTLNATLPMSNASHFASFNAVLSRGPSHSNCGTIAFALRISADCRAAPPGRLARGQAAYSTITP